MKVNLDGLVGRTVTMQNARASGEAEPETGRVERILQDFAWDGDSAFTMVEMQFADEEGVYYRCITRDELLEQHPDLEVTDGTD